MWSGEKSNSKILLVQTLAGCLVEGERVSVETLTERSAVAMNTLMMTATIVTITRVHSYTHHHHQQHCINQSINPGLLVVKVIQTTARSTRERLGEVQSGE